MAIRAIKNNVRIRFAGMDMLSLSGTLMPLKNTTEKRETELKLTCPVCADEAKPMAMVQFYVGATCGHVPADGSPGFKTGDCNAKGKLRMEGKVPVFVSTDELATVNGTDDEKDDKAPTIIDLTVESRPAVDAATFPAGNAYWFEPDSPTSTYTIFSELATDPKYALLGTLELRRGTPGLYEVVPHRGGIVLTQLLRPSEVYTYDPEKPPVKDVEAAMAAKLVEALANEEFDPESYTNERTAAIRKLITDKMAGNPIAVAANEAQADKPGSDVDLTLALGAALAAVKAAKSAP